MDDDAMVSETMRGILKMIADGQEMRRREMAKMIVLFERINSHARCERLARKLHKYN